jgi:hypothetical protein
VAYEILDCGVNEVKDTLELMVSRYVRLPLQSVVQGILNEMLYGLHYTIHIKQVGFARAEQECADNFFRHLRFPERGSSLGAEHFKCIRAFGEDDGRNGGIECRRKMLDGEWNSLAVDEDGGIASECGLHPFLDHVNGMVAVHVGLVIEPMITGTLVTCHVFNETVVGFFAEGGVNNKEYNILKFLVLIHGSVGTVFCKLTKVCKLSCIARVKKCEEKVARTGVFLCRLYGEKKESPGKRKKLRKNPAC